MSRVNRPRRPRKRIENPTPPRFSRRAFIKGTAGVATSALIANQFASSSEAFREYLPYDPSRDSHYGYNYGWLQHHYPSTETTDEKFVFVRLKYPGGDWYTNAIDWYRWGYDKAADVKFAEVLAENTSIDVETHQHAQYVSIDDEHIFNYPYIFMTGHMGIRLSDSQVRRLREYLERGGFIHAEDCDIRLYNGRGGMRPSIHRLMKQVFPDKKLERIDITHPIYHTLFDHDEYLGGDKLLPERVSPYGHFDEALMIDDRVAVYFCPTDLNCAWEGRECAPGGEEQRRWAFRQGMNVVAYALSR